MKIYLQTQQASKMNESKAHVCFGLLYILSVQILSTNSRTSTLWKLDVDEGKIVSVSSDSNCHLESTYCHAANRRNVADEHNISPQVNSIEEYQYSEDGEESTFFIITTVTNYRENTWRRQARGKVIVNLAKNPPDNPPNSSMNSGTHSKEDVLDCGKPVNFTYYDDLIGVAQRYSHPIVPEPEVAFLFLKKKGPKSLKNFDVDALERRLRKAKMEKPRALQLYNQIGNFWRIKGDARRSIECFRKVLAIAPTNAEVLLNLARVLFNLQYLDDAIHLTRRSLEVQPRDRSAWRQYFTLGEIFKAYGHFQESVNHLRQALELYPQYEPIKKAIADVENISASSLHIFTIIIIIFLVMCVLYVILSSNEGSQNNQEQEQKATRHFNRAMAMRSLKGFTQRSFKNRK